MLREVVRTAYHASVRVDPRPLRADPTIVELTPALAQVVPEYVSTRTDPLAPVAPTDLARRVRVLEGLGLRQADISGYPRCPGLLLSGPPEIRQDGRPVTRCPPDEFKVVIVGLPRLGGAYWPGSGVDRRAEAPDGAWTLRVIERHLTPFGFSGAADDFVAHRDPQGRWRILMRVGLLVTD